MNKIAKAADLLLQSRLTGQRLPTLPDEVFPTTLSEAYTIQAALTQRLLAHHGGQVVGHKIACTNEAAQRFLHLDGPFHGPLLSALIHDTPARFKAADFFDAGDRTGVRL